VTATGTMAVDRWGTSAKLARARVIAPWALAILLAVSNMATLLSDRMHNYAYNALATVAALAGQGAADALLAHSPTRARSRAVDNATRQLQARNASLAQEHDALRTLTARRASALKAVTTRTLTVLSTRSADALATLPMRAAPYVGIVALVGFTSVELKADCELARALAELNAEHENDPVDTGTVCKAVDQVPSPEQAWSTTKAQASTALRNIYDALESAASRLGLTVSTQPLK
jgi:hypothetical protein